MSFKNLAAFMVIVLVPLLSFAGPFTNCKSITLQQSRLSLIVGAELNQFYLSESEGSRSVIDYTEWKNADLPLLSVPPGDYRVADIQSCFYSGGQFMVYPFYILQNSEGQAYYAPAHRVEQFVQYVVFGDVKRISFPTRDHLKRYRTERAAKKGLYVQAEDFCNQFNKTSKIVKEADVNLVRNKPKLKAWYDVFDASNFGLDWSRIASIEFQCI